MRKRFLVVCMFFLLVISSIGPLSFGSKLSEKEILIENYNRYNDPEITGYGQIPGYECNDFIDTESEKVNILKEASKPLNGPMDSAWPMKCHDNHHTSQSPYSTADNPYIEKWRFKSDWIENTPVIDSNGTIYFASDDRTVVAVYPNGTVKWRFNTEGNMLGSSPAIDEDGTIYVGSWDTKLYAINPNGTLKWSVGTGGSIDSSPAIGEDGTIYFGTLAPGNSIVAVNPNGTIKWSYPTGDRIYSDPCIGDDGTIYIGSNDQYLYAMNTNGTLKWRFKTGVAFASSASIAADGTIYAAGSWDNHLYALYPNGTVKWVCSIMVNSNPSIGIDGTIYIGAYQLYAVYPNGTVKWSFNLGNERWIAGSCPAISADGTIYFGTNIGDAGGGEIIAVNPNGTERWRKQIDKEWVDSSPSIAEDGTVYIGSTYMIDRGYLHAFGNVESNSPPEAPVISGETNGNVGVEYWYTFVSHDPDNNPIRLFVDWGDGNSGWVEWVDWFASGEDMWAEHTWTTQGTYIIKAKVQDVMGEESNWSEFEVTMPRNRVSYSSLFIRLLERFPLLVRLLFFVKAFF